MYSQQIKSDVDSFQGYVQKLSGNIQSVSSLWRDSQYSVLMSGISTDDCFVVIQLYCILGGHCFFVAKK